MADKEERIWLEFDIPKPKGAIEATRCTTMTRQEAIKRMAKALEEKSEQMGRECLSSDPYNNPLGAEDLAEAALDSLLED